MAGQEAKPNAARLGWRLRGSAVPFQNDVFAIRDDEVAVNGQTTRYAYMERDEAVIVVPVTRNSDMVVVRQYRYPVDEWCFEVPAGGTHDVETESLQKVARKELLEETGAKAGHFTYVGFFYTANSFTDEKCHVFLAEDVDLAERARTENTEEIHVELMPAEQAVAFARTAKMKTGPCALAVLLCEPLLRERGYIA
jgi:8-oxo-dGTP pyrophosphatase MutT (NUDIX family)